MLLVLVFISCLTLLISVCGLGVMGIGMFLLIRDIVARHNEKVFSFNKRKPYAPSNVKLTIGIILIICGIGLAIFGVVLTCEQWVSFNQIFS